MRSVIEFPLLTKWRARRGAGSGDTQSKEHEVKWKEPQPPLQLANLDETNEIQKYMDEILNTIKTTRKKVNLIKKKKKKKKKKKT